MVPLSHGRSAAHTPNLGSFFVISKSHDSRVHGRKFKTKLRKRFINRRYFFLSFFLKRKSKPSKKLGLQILKTQLCTSRNRLTMVTLLFRCLTIPQRNLPQNLDSQNSQNLPTNGCNDTTITQLLLTLKSNSPKLVSQSMQQYYHHPTPLISQNSPKLVSQSMQQYHRHPTP